MKKDIDTLSAELTKEFSAKEMSFPAFEKALPPKLAYRFRRWLNSLKYRVAPEAAQEAEEAVKHAIEELEFVRSLKKNEAMVSFYDNGAIKMDFGSEVSPKLKAAAMEWAKKRGLKASESELNKNASASNILFNNSQIGVCVKRLKFS